MSVHIRPENKTTTRFKALALGLLLLVGIIYQSGVLQEQPETWHDFAQRITTAAVNR